MLTKEEWGRVALYMEGCAEVEFRAELGYYPMLHEAVKAIRALAAGTHVICRAEPVAWVDVVDTHEGPYNFHGQSLMPAGKHSLYAQEVEGR